MATPHNPKNVDNTPQAQDDAFAGTENGRLVLDVLANDKGGGGKSLYSVNQANPTSAALSGTSALGASVAIVDGEIVYRADGQAFDALGEGQTLVDTFSYTIQLGKGAFGVAVVNVTVTGTNDGPVAQADTAAGLENQALVIDVLANDTDVDAGAVLTLAEASAPAGLGEVSIVDGKLVFTPGADFDHLAQGATQTVTLNYVTADEHGARSSAAVTVAVTGTNDGPVAQADTAAGLENQTLVIDVLANDTDVDAGAVLSIAEASAPSGLGEVSIVDGKLVFAPGAAFDHLAVGATETVTLNYVTADEHGARSSAAVTVTVTGTNDGPVAAADAGGVDADKTLTLDVLANDSDADDGAVLTLTAVSAPAGKGEVSIVDNQVVFEPGAAFGHLAVGATETVTLQYTVADEHGALSTATVAVTVTGVNHTPEAAADTATGDEGATLVIDVLANDSDADAGAVLTLTDLSAPDKGAASIVDGKVVFDPGSDFDGLAAGESETVTLNYTVSDEHGAEAASTVTITVTGTNDAPVAAIDAAATEENQALKLDVLANDTDVDDGAVLSLTAVSGPAGKGGVAIVDNQLTFDPGADFDHLKAGDTETVTLSYTVSDEAGASSNATVAVVVTGTNDAPVAAADTAGGDESQALVIDVLANDTDVDDGAVLVLSSVSGADGKGAVSVVDNKLAFDPGSDFQHLKAGETETVTIDYVVTDGVTSSTGTVALTVTGTNDLPVATADAAATDEDTALTLSGSILVANDVDIDGDTLVVSSVDGAETIGTVTLVDGDVVYSSGAAFQHLAPGETATDSFTYTVSDGHGGTSSAQVEVLVSGVNDAPTARDDSGFTLAGDTAVFDVLANDSDPEGDALSVTGVSGAVGGVAVLNSDGTISFTPAAGFSGEANFSYTVADAFGATDEASVALVVNQADHDQVNTDVFLQGAFMEIGVSGSGSLGSRYDAPSNYHSAFSGQISYVVDRDGWDTGAPPLTGDFTLPGTPVDTIVVAFNHKNYAQDERTNVRTINTTTSDTSGDGVLSATTSGLAGGAVQFTQVITLDPGATYYKTTITLTNTSSVAVADVRFMRSFDPDQDQSTTGDFSTYNDVLSNPTAGNDLAISQAIGSHSGVPVSLVAFDDSARGSVFGFANTNAYDAYAWNAPRDPNGQYGDQAITMTFNVGTLAAGETVTKEFFTTLNGSANANDMLVGRTVADNLNAGAGDDILIGLTGADTLTGAAGDDQFVFSVGSGRDVITDFQAGANTDDVIELRGFGFDSLADVRDAAVQSGANVVIYLGGSDSLTLQNVTLSSLHGSDFLFA